MRIPVCKIAQYGNVFGTVFYDTDTNKFLDERVISDRHLPIQDYLSCQVIVGNLCTVVGRDYSNGDYVVCFGDNSLYILSKSSLYKYKLTNIKVCKNNRFLCIVGRQENLSYLFPDKSIRFLDKMKYVQESSLGVAKKFTAKYKDALCVVKFQKLSSAKDLENEVKYYNLARIFGVECCKVKLSTYYGRSCCISEFRYNPEYDVFKSFKSIGKSPMEIYSLLSKKGKMKFDRLMILDYIVEQQDRHMSNIALCNGDLYPSFDNGECLGIGGIGYFSGNFRIYVEHLSREYIKSLFRGRSLTRSRILRVLQDKSEQQIVLANMERLGLLGKSSIVLLESVSWG